MSAPGEPAPATHDVVVYTSPMWVPCEQLKRFLAAHDVPFRVRDLLMDEDAQDRLDEARIRSTPALEIDGRIYAGDALTPERIKALLGL